MEEYKKEMIQLFKNNFNKKRYDNYNDVLIYPLLNSKTEIIKRKFKISKKGELLLFRDTSVQGVKNKGIVISTLGFHYIATNNPSVVFMPWNKIKYIKKNKDDESLEFYIGNSDTPYASFHFDLFVKTSNYNSNDIEEFIKLLNEIKELDKTPIEKLFSDYKDEIVETRDNEKYEQALDLCDECVNECKQKKYKREGEEFYELIIDFLRSTIYFVQEDKLKAEYYTKRVIKTIDTINEDLEEKDLHEYGEFLWLKSNALYNLALLKEEQENYSEARKLYFNSIELKSEEDAEDKLEQIKDFQEKEEKYIEYFLEQDFNKRLFILPITEIKTLDSDLISVLTMEQTKKIEFPIGHPIPNQLYIAKPYTNNFYIPFEDYDLVLLEDRLREFCWLAQSLGATKISIESNKKQSTNEKQNKQLSISGKADVKLASGLLSYFNEKQNERLAQIENSISLNQEFHPTSKPIVPTNLLWYEHEASWQRLVTQRLQGGLLNHTERISSNSIELVKASDLTHIKGDFKNLRMKTEGEVEKQTNTMFEKKESVSLEIHIEFAPLNTLVDTENSTTTDNTNLLENNNPTLLTSEEQEYLDEYKECLQYNNGEFSPSEIRLLDRLRVRLDLSEERVRELKEQANLENQLSEEEQEYLEDIRLFLEDGVITEKERKILERSRNQLGISEERAKEIEKTI